MLRARITLTSRILLPARSGEAKNQLVENPFESTFEIANRKYFCASTSLGTDKEFCAKGLLANSCIYTILYERLVCDGALCVFANVR